MLFKSMLGGHQKRVFQVTTNLFVSSLNAYESNALAADFDNTSPVKHMNANLPAF